MNAHELEPSTHEIVVRGQAIYDERLRAMAEASYRDKYIVIDIYTGEYEIADDDLTATLRLFERLPGAMTFGVHVGHRASGRIGATAKPA